MKPTTDIKGVSYGEYPETLHNQLRKLIVINSCVKYTHQGHVYHFRNKYVFSSLQQKCLASQPIFKKTLVNVYSKPDLPQI